MTKHDTEVKVGIFISIGIGLIMLAILLLGGADSLFTRHNKYTTHVTSVEGLIPGAKVVLGGLRVGAVKSIDFDSKRKDLEITMLIPKKYEEWIRKDTTAELFTQGVLGDKYISLSSSQMDQPVLSNNSEIPNRPTSGLSQFLSKSDQLLVSINSIASSLDRVLKNFEAKNRAESIFESMTTTTKNLAQASIKLNNELDQIPLKQAVKNLNGILEKINNGTGTIGALVNDPSLYYDAKALMGGANRNRIVRNLVRKTIKSGEEEAVSQKPATK